MSEHLLSKKNSLQYSTSCVEHTPTLRLELEFTNHCFARCITCPREHITAPGYLAPDMFQQIVQKIEQDKVAYVTICGLGEPLAHPQAVAYFQALAQSSAIPTLVTNAQLLDGPMLEALLTAGLRSFVISIPSLHQELFEKIHAGIDYRTVMDNFHRLLEHRDRYGLDIVVHSVLSKLNEDTIDEVIDFCRQQGIKSKVLYTTNRARPDFPEELLPHRFNLFTLFTNDKIEDLCILYSANTFIGHDGLVYPCCNDVSRRYPLCRYIDHPHATIIEMKKSHQPVIRPLCTTCDFDRYKERISALLPDPSFSLGYHITSAQGLSAVIGSVLAQTFQNFELLLYIDTADQKELLAIGKVLERYVEHPRIRTFKSKQPIGSAHAKKSLVELARGRYYIDLTPQTLPYPYALEIFYIHHISFPRFSVLRGGRTFKGNKEFPKLRRVIDGKSLDIDDLYTTFSIERRTLMELGNYPVGTKDAERTLFEQIDAKQIPVLNLNQILFKENVG